MRLRVSTILFATLLTARSAAAATLTGVVTDTTGGVLGGATVVLRGVATGEERGVETADDGRFTLSTDTPGYLVIVRRSGFSDAARTGVVETASDAVDVAVELEVGVVSAQASVTANRAGRETRTIPLHVESISRAAVEQANTLSTGDALAVTANITPVGNGPFGVRPRLRGLDSTRMLLLVDGERLNTARQATDRTGAETGLVSPDAISRIEIVNGAGTLLYGSDAPAGTVNIITNEPGFTDATRLNYGVNGFYSSNENGRRGTATVGFTSPAVAVRVQAGLESFDNDRAGSFDVDDTRPYFASGQLRQTDTVDTNLGFALKSFPDPFNTPYVRRPGDCELGRERQLPQRLEPVPCR